MAKIYRSKDRISLQIGEVAVKVAPLTFHQKAEIQTEITNAARNGDTMGIIKAAFLCVKYSVKDISGVKTSDDKNYKLEMENGTLTDECVNELFGLEESDKLSMVCLNLVQNKFENFQNPETGDPIEGVQVIKENKSAKKSRRTTGS